SADVMPPNAMWRDHANRFGPGDDSVVVEINRGVILIEVVAELGGISLEEKVLNVEVGNHHLLMTIVKCIQAAVGVLLQVIEVGQVVFEAIRLQIAKNAQSRLLFVVDESPKIALELLNSRAHGDEVVVRNEIVDLVLDKCLLQSHMIVEAVRPALGIDVHNAALAGLQVIHGECRGEDDSPVLRLEAGIAVIELSGETENLIYKELPASAEENERAGIAGGNQTGSWQPARIQRADCTAGECKKRLAAKDGIVAFQLVAIEGIVPVPLGVYVFARIGISAIALQRILLIPISRIPAIGFDGKIFVLCWWSLDCRSLLRRGLIRTPPQLAIRFFRFGGSLSGLGRNCSRQRTIHRTRRHVICRCAEFDFNRQHFPGTDLNLRLTETLITLSTQIKVIGAGGQIPHAKNAVAIGHRLER